jgi:hypothetical protein
MGCPSAREIHAAVIKKVRFSSETAKITYTAVLMPNYHSNFNVLHMAKLPQGEKASAADLTLFDQGVS